MNLQHLDWRVTSLLNETASLKGEIRLFFQNTKNSFEERWEAFKQFARLGGEEDSGIYHGWDDIPLFPTKNWRGETVNELNWYDDFGIERYESIDLLKRGLDSLLDRLWYNGDFKEQEIAASYEKYEESEPHPLSALEWALTVYKQPILIQAAEALMRDGVTRFTYDW